VREQFLMAATAQNLKRLVRYLASMPPVKKQLRNLKSNSKSLRPFEPCRIGIALRRRRPFFNSYFFGGHLLSVS